MYIFVNIICLINISCTETGVDSQESMDSTQNYSDGKSLSKDFESLDSNSDYSAKEVFKNIRSRYLSRVHSVNELSKDVSLVDQAFFKLKSKTSISKDSDSFDVTGTDLTFEIENVTLDETNDDDSNKTSLESTDDYPGKVIAEAVLPSFETKEIKRQQGLDSTKKKIVRQNAIDDFVDSVNDNIRYNSSFDSRDIKNVGYNSIFNKNLSNLYRGKFKSFSTDNLNSNGEFKNGFKEATSMEFVYETSNVSETSLFSEESDSVFLSPLEKNNNVSSLIDKESNKNSNVPENDKENSSENVESKTSNLPVVKAENILPFPYPDDIRSKRESDDIFPRPSNNFTRIDETIENDFKKLSEQLQVNFKAALERISANDNDSSNLSETIIVQIQQNEIVVNTDVTDNIRPIKRLSTFKGEENILEQTESSPSSKETNVEDIIDVKSNLENKNETLEVTEKDSRQDQQDNSMSKVDSQKTNYEKATEMEGNNVKSTNNIKSTEQNNLSNDLKTTTEPAIDDNVSYHLKINTVTDLTSPNLSNSIDTQKTNSTERKNKVQTILSPIKIVNSNIDHASSPIILSPVLIRPIFFKPNTSVVEQSSTSDTKKGTVYYDDIDQVITKESPATSDVKIKDTESKRKGIYQKNTKLKPLPFLSPKKFGSNENVMESKPPTPTKSPPKTVVRLSKSPEWLVDNQYYQPMENVPFVINTVQTFVKETPLKPERQAKQINVDPVKISSDQTKKVQEQENYYEEIGQPLKSNKPINAADDEKISNKIPSDEDFTDLTREELLKVPRKPKRTKKHDTKVLSKPKDSESAEKEISSITKSVISLSRSPSANDMTKSKSVGDIVQSLSKNLTETKPEAPMRKYSLQSQSSPNTEVETGSLPRLRKAYHWKTLEHKRLSQPIRSLNDTSPSRLLRKLGFLSRSVPCDICDCK